MEKTTLIDGNGRIYTREVPKVVITTYVNDTALENLIHQTGIPFKRNEASGCVEGQPVSWEQFASIFLTYDYLTHDQNNWDGNVIYLRSNMNVPFGRRLYYYKEGARFLGVDGNEDGAVTRKPNTCYTVIFVCVADGEEHTYTTLGTFGDKRDARAALKEKRDKLVEQAERGDLWISLEQECKDEFTDNEDCFEIWLDGYYATDHVLIKIEESEYIR